jgi:deoxyribodipyrimidine photo-lyase
MSMLASNTAVQHVDSNALPDWMRCERTKVLNSHTTPKESGKSIVYWMQRDVRTVDNWALLYAAWLAEHHDVPLHVMYCLHPPPIEQVTSDLPPKIMVETKMTQRHGSFLLGGLQCVHSELKQKNVPLHVILPTSPTTVGDAVVDFLDSVQPRSVVCDFSPLRTYRNWMEHQTAPRLMQIPMIQVDAHNVVPVWHASPKPEVGARTLRPKLHKVVDTFLTDFPSFGGNTHVCPTCPEFAMDTYTTYLDMDTTVPPVPWAKPGTAHALIQFDAFAKSGLAKFDELRNNPNLPNVCSNLSPWLNHGHVSFQSLARLVKKLNKYANGTASYIEEGLVRRELSDNFVYYSPTNYDDLTAAAEWAQDTLQVHASDPREWTYTTEELTHAQSHDGLWNAAQLQLTEQGTMHGFLRMYWAKKILEWTPNPSVALRTAQYLNDKYALDGNDPNGFVGVGWSIMGIHDMGWKEREIFGKIRYMNYAGCKRKFLVDEFVNKYSPASENAIKAAAAVGKEAEGTKKKASAVKGTAKKAPPTTAGPTSAGKKRKA